MSTLLEKSDQRRGESFAAEVVRIRAMLDNDLLRRKVEQAMVDHAITILGESPLGQGGTWTVLQTARRTFAVQALDQPTATMVRLMPHVGQNLSIQTDGGESTDSVIEYVVKTQVINGLYPNI